MCMQYEAKQAEAMVGSEKAICEAGIKTEGRSRVTGVAWSGGYG